MSSTASVATAAGSASDRLPDPGSFYVHTLLDAFRRNADRVALIDETGSLTYAELLDEMFRLARALERHGVGRGDGVAAIDGNTQGIVLTWLASSLLGCYFVSIPTDVTAAEQASILEYTDVSVVVYEPAVHAERAVELAGRRGVPPLLSLGPGPAGADLGVRDQPSAPFPPRAKDCDIAELVFTGGSTGGRLKAAAYTHERQGELVRAWLTATSAQDSAEAAAYRAPDCRLLRPWRATASTGIAVLPTLLHGGALVLHRGFDADAVLRAISVHRITAIVAFPSQLYQLLDHPELALTDHSSLRLLIYTGAPMSPNRCRQAISVFGPVLCTIYGQSETRMMCVLRPEDHRVDAPELLRSVGRPRPGVDLEVRTGTGVAPVGTIGEIYVRSPFRMNHYWREPELSAEAIVDGWSRTRDLGYQDAEGHVYLVDRVQNMVRVGSRDCFTIDIENVLNAHRAVRESVVVGLPDPRTGEAVHAAAVRYPDAEVSEVELRELVLAELGEFHAPRSVLFLDEVPMTRSGKPDKNAIRELVSRRLRSAGREI